MAKVEYNTYDRNSHSQSITTYSSRNMVTAVPHIKVPQQFSSINDAIQHAHSGENVIVSSGTYNESLPMKSGVDVDGDSRDNTIINGSVTFSSKNNATLRDVHVKNRITINYGWNNRVYKVKSSHTNYYGVDAYGSSPDIDRFYSNISPHYGYGVYAHNSASPVIVSSYFTNKDIAVYVLNSSEASVEDTYFCQQDNYDIYAGSGCYVDADYDDNIFSGDPEDYTYGNVDYPADWDECGLSKVAASGSATERMNHPSPPSVTGGDDPGLSDYREAVRIYRTIRQNLRLDFEAGKPVEPRNYLSDYALVIDKFHQVVDKYPGSWFAINALGRIADCYWEINEPGSVVNFINGIVGDSRFTALKLHALNLLIPYHLYQKDYQQAIKLSDTILKDLPKNQLACEILFGKGLIYKYYVKDLDKAAEMFSEVISQYPDNMTALSARAELEEMEPGYFATDSSTIGESDVLASQNYPNPFNPRTSIQYNLPEDGRVVLKIYDIQGREVITLVDKEKEAGHHTAYWDGKDQSGSDVTSGMYFYQVRTRGQIVSKKMILVR